MSLDCPFFIAQWCICLWIVHSLLSYGAYVSGLSILYCPMVHMSLDCPFFIVLVHMVHMSLDCPFFIVLWCICLWIVHSLLSYGAYVSGLSILYRPMVHMSLDCPFFIVLWCICLWIVHSLLPLRFSLTVMSSALTR